MFIRGLGPALDPTGDKGAVSAGKQPAGMREREKERGGVGVG